MAPIFRLAISAIVSSVLGRGMLDGIDSRLHGHRRVDGLAVAGDLQSEQVRFVDCRHDLVRGEVAGDLDDARALFERPADGGAPGVRAVDLPREFRPVVRRDRAFGRMSARSRDDVAAGEHPRRRDRVRVAPFGKQVRRLAHPIHVADRREPGFKVVTEVPFTAQYAGALARLLVDGRVWIRIGQMDVHVDEARHHRLASDVDDLRIGWPALHAGREDPADHVALDHEGAGPDTAAHRVEDTATAEDERAAWAWGRPSWNASRIIRRPLGRRQHAPTVLQTRLSTRDAAAEHAGDGSGCEE